MSRGQSLILDTLLVMSFAALLAAIGAAMIFNSEVAKVKQQILEIEQRITKSEKKIPGYPKDMRLYLYHTRSLNAEILTLTEENRDLKGLIIGNRNQAKIDLKELSDKQLKEAQKSFKKYLGSQYHPVSYTNLADLYTDLIAEAYVLHRLIKHTEVDAQGVSDLKRQKERALQIVREKKERIVKKLSTERSALKEENSRKMTDASDAKEDLERKLRKFQSQLEEDQESYNVRIRQLETDIDNRLEKIRRLKEKIRRRRALSDLLPDGEVIMAHHSLGYVWLNLGRAHGLQKGTIFKVFHYSKGGKRLFKGKLEVVRVDVNMSQARILEQKFRDMPIVKGDYVFSPFFDKKRRITVVFAGKGPSSQLYKLRDYQRWIQNIGQEVRLKVDNRTDFLILLKDHETSKAYEDTQNFPWIVYITEKEFLEYMKK